MKIDFEKISQDAFVDELQKLAVPMPRISGLSNFSETAAVAAHEAAIKAKKMAAQAKPVSKVEK
jgi:hypothetical protein